MYNEESSKFHLLHHCTFQIIFFVTTEGIHQENLTRDICKKRIEFENEWRARKGKFSESTEEDFFKFLDDDEKVKNEVLKSRAKGSTIYDQRWKRFQGSMEISNGMKFKGSVDEQGDE